MAAIRVSSCSPGRLQVWAESPSNSVAARVVDETNSPEMISTAWSICSASRAIGSAASPQAPLSAGEEQMQKCRAYGPMGDKGGAVRVTRDTDRHGRFERVPERSDPGPGPTLPMQPARTGDRFSARAPRLRSGHVISSSAD
jgi:hypothetical protein